MKIRMLKQTVCNGKIVFPGDVLETSDKDARILIGMAKAIETTEDDEQQTEDGEGQETETQQKPRGKSKGKQSPNNRMDEVDQTRTDG